MKMTILTLGLAVFLVTAFTASASACNFGCTPGYWKQPQHSSDWGYPTTQTVYEAFGCAPAALASTSLLTALKSGGGGEYALTRHAVASLLNADAKSCFDGGSPAEVIEAYCTALDSSDPGAIEAQKYLFEKDNDQDCTLGGSGRAIGRSR